MTLVSRSEHLGRTTEDIRQGTTGNPEKGLGAFGRRWEWPSPVRRN